MRLAVLAVALGACTGWPPQRVPVNHYLGDPLDVDSVRRVLVLPFREADGVMGQREQVREAFINELAKIKRFEIVPLPDEAEEYHEVYLSLTRGAISADALVRFSERYNVDGVVIGTLTSYRPYPPRTSACASR